MQTSAQHEDHAVPAAVANRPKPALRPLLLGGGLAALTIGAAWWMPLARQLDLFAVLLAGIGAVYIGFALMDGRTRLVITEVAGALAFGALALAGLWLHPLILAAGYGAHGVWDMIHPHGVHTPTPRGYIPLCVVYDWIVGAYIVAVYATA